LAEQARMTTIASILIVGCGNMGGAMLAGWLSGGLDPARFTVVDPNLAEAPGGVTLLRELPEGWFDLILLGVKPQLLGDVAPRLEALAGPQTVVLSILAGAELSSLAERFARARAVVRIMPNLAASLGRSPLALTGSDVSADLRASLDTLLAPLGTPEWFADDSQFDLITALVGSGPAFVYRFIEALADGAAHMGLPAEQAQRLSLAMVEGAAALAAQAEAGPRELARRVTSPGGTTEAGLRQLDADRALAALVEQTLRAARDRGADLAEAARKG
jgi:pyrroline-5-carboxylate reductase